MSTPLGVTRFTTNNNNVTPIGRPSIIYTSVNTAQSSPPSPHHTQWCPQNLTNYTPLYVTQANQALRSPPMPYVPIETLRAHSSPGVRSVNAQYRQFPPLQGQQIALQGQPTPLQSQTTIFQGLATLQGSPTTVQNSQASPTLQGNAGLVRRPSLLCGSRMIPSHALGFQSRGGPMAITSLVRTESPAARTIEPSPYKPRLPPVLASRQSPNMSIRRTQPASSRRDSGAYATDVRTIDDTCSSVMTATAGYIDVGEGEGGVPTQSDFSFGGRIEVGVRTERSHDVSISVASQRGRLRCRSGLIRQQRGVREISAAPVSRGLRRFQCTNRARKLPTLRNIETTTKDTKACAIRIEQKLGEIQAHLVGQAAQRSLSQEAAATACPASSSEGTDLQAVISGNAAAQTLTLRPGLSNPQQFSLVSSACGDGASTSVPGRSFSSDTLYDNVGGVQQDRQKDALQELNALNEAAAELQRCVSRVQKAILYGKGHLPPAAPSVCSSRHMANSEAEELHQEETTDPGSEVAGEAIQEERTEEVEQNVTSEPVCTGMEESTVAACAV